MANISTSSSFFTSPNLHFNSHKPSNSFRFGRTRVSAALAIEARMSKTSSLSLYEVLGVGVEADTLVVKAAYRRLARVLHPDVGSGESADEFMKVHSAYTTLVDPEKRAAYDRSLVQRQTRGSSPVRYAGYRSRRWETDQCW